MSEETQTTVVTAPADAEVSVTVTPAHTQSTTLHIIECVPSHEAREHDPHYRIFNQTRDRLKKAGLLKCWIGNADCGGQIELHHSAVEFSLQNGVDLTRFEEAFPEFTGKTDEEFKEWIESEHGLLPLCKRHHTGYLGIHVLPYPLYLPQKFWREGLIAPARVITGSGDGLPNSKSIAEPEG